MKYTSFISLNFIVALLISFCCITYELFPFNISIENPYINNCNIIYTNNSDLISIKDIKHKNFMIFPGDDMPILEMIIHKYDISWDGCNCFDDIINLSCMNLNYSYCTNPINKNNDQMFIWSTKVIYKNDDKIKDLQISFDYIDIKKEKKRLEKYICKNTLFFDI